MAKQSSSMKEGEMQLEEALERFLATIEIAGLGNPAGYDATEMQDALKDVFDARLLLDMQNAGYQGGITIPWPADELTLFATGELPDRQAGYRNDAISGTTSTGWPEDLYVIASASADPFAISAESGRIHFARHGTGTWAFEKVADDLAQFIDVLARWIEFFVIEHARNIMNDDFEVEPAKLAEIRNRVLADLDESSKSAFVRALGI
jgi:hypothetical protein